VNRSTRHQLKKKERGHELILLEERDGAEGNPPTVHVVAQSWTEEEGGIRALLGCLRMFWLIREAVQLWIQMVLGQLRLHTSNRMAQNKKITASNGSNNRGDVAQPQLREWREAGFTYIVIVDSKRI
jgi:hypothetical protein